MKRDEILTLTTVTKVASANLIAQLPFFPAGQLLVLVRRGAPVVHSVVEGVCLYDRANMNFFLDATRMNDWPAILAFIRMSNWGRSDRAFFVLVFVLIEALLIFYNIIVIKVTWSLGSGRSGHELRVDGKCRRETTRGGAGTASVRAIVGECEKIHRRTSDGLRGGGFGTEYIIMYVGKVEPKVVVEV